MIIMLFGYTFLTIGGVLLTKPNGVRWWVVALVVSLCHLISSVKVVGEQQIGALIVWGKILLSLDSGPVIAPFPLRVRRLPKNVIQIEFGTRTEAADVKAAERDVSVIYGEPFRVTFGTASLLTEPEKIRYKGDPLIGRLTFDPHVVTRFQIRDPVAFINEIGDIEQAQEQIREAAKGAIQAYAGTHTPAHMIEGIDEVNTLLTKRVEILIGEKADDDGTLRPSWGIDFRSASVTSAGLPKRVNQSMADRGEAAFKAEAVLIAATAEGQKREQEGAGTAKARQLFILAEAIRT